MQTFLLYERWRPELFLGECLDSCVVPYIIISVASSPKKRKASVVTRSGGLLPVVFCCSSADHHYEVTGKETVTQYLNYTEK